MDKHLSSEEIFALSNEWDIPLEAKVHLNQCSHCQALVAKEKALNGWVQESMSPSREVDLADAVLNQWSPKLTQSLSSIGSFVPVFLGLGLALLLVSILPVVKSYLPVKSPETNYFTLGVFTMLCLFMFDAIRTYLKEKRALS